MPANWGQSAWCWSWGQWPKPVGNWCRGGGQCGLALLLRAWTATQRNWKQFRLLMPFSQKTAPRRKFYRRPGRAMSPIYILSILETHPLTPPCPIHPLVQRPIWRRLLHMFPCRRLRLHYLHLRRSNQGNRSRLAMMWRAWGGTLLGQSRSFMHG